MGTDGGSYAYTSAGRSTPGPGRVALPAPTAYNNAGDLQSVSYSNGVTPESPTAFDRRGRQSSVTCNGITTTLTYNDANQLLSESYAGGAWPG